MPPRRRAPASRSSPTTTGTRGSAASTSNACRHSHRALPFSSENSHDGRPPTRLSADCHSPNGLCSSSWCSIATTSKPCAGEQPRDAVRGEVHAMAGDVQVKPARAADRRLPGGEVRHRDDQATARDQPAVHPVKRRPRVRHVFEHVPQRDGVGAPGAPRRRRRSRRARRRRRGDTGQIPTRRSRLRARETRTGPARRRRRSRELPVPRAGPAGRAARGQSARARARPGPVGAGRGAGRPRSRADPPLADRSPSAAGPSAPAVTAVPHAAQRSSAKRA